LIEEYMSTAAVIYYAPGTLPTIRVSLSTFFRHVVREENIGLISDVRPSVMTRFIAHERARGRTSGTIIGHISTFFRWLIAEERYERANPVVGRIHSQRNAPASPRPYKDGEINAIREQVEQSGKIQLMLAFSIGLECGLRVGEVANIRLSDVDLEAHQIIVRLPTKNKRTRTVPFHSEVERLYLKQRNPNSVHDHLLLNKASNPFTGGLLDAWFNNALLNAPEPAASFHFHRLRHTWATRLMNNGMELAVLKVLGGWESWNSMQRYIRVLDSTVQAQYEASYAKLQMKEESDEGEVISLMDSP
jgi:site-specific recombinase XerD